MTPDPLRTFRALPRHFHQEYFRWHSSEQYEGAGEFSCLEDVLTRPPARERDDWYASELDVIDRFHRPFAQSRVLEIGCGDGNLTWKLARRAAHLTSWDIDPGAVELTRLRLDAMGLKNVTAERCDVCGDLGASLPQFDIVMFVQVLEHLPASAQAPAFDRVLRLIAPGGCLFVSTPNRWTVWDSHDTGKPLIHWLPRRLRVKVAGALGWGLRTQDPSWSEPPVLHDYVSYRWMLNRARSLYPGIRSSRMQYYPTPREWLNARRRGRGAAALLRTATRWIGELVPLNYYFGSKIILSRPSESTS